MIEITNGKLPLVSVTDWSIEKNMLVLGKLFTTFESITTIVFTDAEKFVHAIREC